MHAYIRVTGPRRRAMQHHDASYTDCADNVLVRYDIYQCVLVHTSMYHHDHKLCFHSNHWQAGIRWIQIRLDPYRDMPVHDYWYGCLGTTCYLNCPTLPTTRFLRPCVECCAPFRRRNSTCSFRLSCQAVSAGRGLAEPQNFMHLGKLFLWNTDC